MWSSAGNGFDCLDDCVEGGATARKESSRQKLFIWRLHYQLNMLLSLDLRRDTSLKVIKLVSLLCSECS